MRRQLEDVHDWGEPIAALWASEAAIYGRFGYGQAAPSVHDEVRPRALRAARRRGPQGSVRLVDADEAFELFPPVYERVRVDAGRDALADERWWKEHRLADPESWRRGASRKFYAAVELDGAGRGLRATTASRTSGRTASPRGEVRVIEALATSPAAERDALALPARDRPDRSGSRSSSFDPGSPLPLLVRDPRALGLRARRRALAAASSTSTPR